MHRDRPQCTERLIDAANEFRRNGMTPMEAIHAAGVRRFRPILLTSSTTFFGLTPMIFETSLQARFLVPMAVSLGFGVAFATTITLVLIPSVYLVVEDLKRLFGGSTDEDDGASDASGERPATPPPDDSLPPTVVGPGE